MKKHSLLAIMLVLAITAGLFNFTQVTAASVDTAAQSLLNEYYNGGNYTKHTEIYYIGEEGGSYDSSCFHAGVDNLIRKTEYTSGKLYMSNAEGTINSGYKDVDGAMAHFTKVGTQEVIDYTVASTSVEDFYFTLFDLKNASGWTVNGDKYSLTLSAENSTPWVHFIAPLWISNHVSISRVTVYESNGLVLELYGTIAGVVEAETLFAKATVNYTKVWSVLFF